MDAVLCGDTHMSHYFYLLLIVIHTWRLQQLLATRRQSPRRSSKHVPKERTQPTTTTTTTRSKTYAELGTPFPVRTRPRWRTPCRLLSRFVKSGERGASSAMVWGRASMRSCNKRFFNSMSSSISRYAKMSSKRIPNKGDSERPTRASSPIDESFLASFHCLRGGSGESGAIRPD